MSPREEHRWLNRIHWANAITFVILLCTGLLLWFPDSRALMNTLGVPTRRIHLLAGTASALLLVLALPRLWRFWWRRLTLQPGRWLNLLITLGATLVWVLTGTVMWIREFPPAWREVAQPLHDLLTWAVAPLFAVHALLRWRRVRLPLPAWWLKRERGVVLPGAAAADSGRRRLVLLGVYGVLAYSAGWAARWLNPGLDHPPAALQRLFSGAGDALQRGFFRIYSVVVREPEFDPATWRLTVDGLVGEPMQFTWEEFRRLPRQTVVRDFRCVTGWVVRDCRWEGVQIAELVQRVQPDPRARFITFYSADGAYTDNLGLKQALEQEVLLAYSLDGQPLSGEMGAPMRLVVPFMYGYKSVKWVERLEFTDRDLNGYWEVRGYAKDAYIRES